MEHPGVPLNSSADDAPSIRCDALADSSPRIGVLVVDDHPLFRDAVKRAVERDGKYEVVGECGDGETATRLTAELRPRIVVLDIGLPVVNGLDVTRRIKSQSPHVRIVILSVHADGEHVLASVGAGADAYLTKDVIAEELSDALQRVDADEVYFCPVALRHLTAIAAASAHTHAHANPQGPLTQRELQILQFLAAGLTNREIAERLSLSPRTVKGHLEGLYLKLGVDNRTSAVTAGIRLGIVGLDDTLV